MKLSHLKYNPPLKFSIAVKDTRFRVPYNPPFPKGPVKKHRQIALWSEFVGKGYGGGCTPLHLSRVKSVQKSLQLKARYAPLRRVEGTTPDLVK